MKLSVLSAAIFAAALPLTALAETAPAPSPAKPVAVAPKAKQASTAAYKAAMDKMHHNMMIEYSGNSDVDFVRGMIAHHQGAVDMAKIELEHGADPDIRKLAQDVVAAQEKEIAFMKTWLDKHGHGKSGEMPMGHDHGAAKPAGN